MNSKVKTKSLDIFDVNTDANLTIYLAKFPDSVNGVRQLLK